MPKKTKREKITADLRRKLHSPAPVPSVPSSAPPVHTNPSTFAFALSSHGKRQLGATGRQNSELSAIKHDLTKTLILAAIAVAIEFGLYWFSKGKI